jgi:hypothetical protein
VGRVPGYRSRGMGSIFGLKIFWEVVDLERSPLSLLSPIEELLGRNSSGSGLQIREYDHGDHATPINPQKLALISPTKGGRSVSKLPSQTKATELLLLLIINICLCRFVTIWTLSCGRTVQYNKQYYGANVKDLTLAAMWPCPYLRYSG